MHLNTNQTFITVQSRSNQGVSILTFDNIAAMIEYNITALSLDELLAVRTYTNKVIGRVRLIKVTKRNKQKKPRNQQND